MLLLQQPSIIVHDYYMYISELVKQICISEGIERNISLNTLTRIKNCIRLTINYEHTLVDFSNDESFPKGTIPVINNPSKTYSVRLDNYDYHSKSDIVIDYSCPNIKNLESYPISSKMVYIAPMIYPVYEKDSIRTIDTLTTFFDPTIVRRKALLDKLGSNHINKNKCFDKNELFKLYTSTKVLINIHQSDFHHTVEELRILPALACGVVVIAEDSPLKETIPYYESVVWVPYDQIVSKTLEVLENYQAYCKPLDRLRSIHEENYVSLKKKIKDVYGSNKDNDLMVWLKKKV